MKNGRVVIDYSICDNAPECSGITVCPTGALYYSEEEQRIKFDGTLCCDCGACADSDGDGCPVGAIRHADTDEDYEAWMKEAEANKDRIAQLNVERYGASLIEDKAELDAAECEEFAAKTCGLVALEFYCDDSIHCLRYSIPITSLKNEVGVEFTYKKVYLTGQEAMEFIKVIKNYTPGELPILVCYRDGKHLGDIVGYYSEKDMDILVTKLKEIFK